MMDYDNATDDAAAVWNAMDNAMMDDLWKMGISGAYAYLEKHRSSKGGWLRCAKGGECFSVDKQTGCMRKKQHKIMCLCNFLNSSLIQLKAKTVVLAHAWGIDERSL